MRNIGGGTLNGINDNGLIMGTMGGDWEGYRAKLYDDGVLTDIGVGVAGNTYSRALNNHGAALFDARGPTWPRFHRLSVRGRRGHRTQHAGVVAHVGRRRRLSAGG